MTDTRLLVSTRDDMKSFTLYGLLDHMMKRPGELIHIAHFQVGKLFIGLEDERLNNFIFGQIVQEYTHGEKNNNS